MYMPKAFAHDDTDQIVATLRATAFGHLVSHHPTEEQPLRSTSLPFFIDDDATTVCAHVARANSHWRNLEGAQALLIVPSADAYVSPRWYPSKAEHGKVVPTWNYELIHIHASANVHDDRDWKLRMVEELSEQQEKHVSSRQGGRPWEVADAPDDYINGLLEAIVGIELHVTHIEAARKLSQNKLDADHAGVAYGLETSLRTSDPEVAALMRRQSAGRS